MFRNSYVPNILDMFKAAYTTVISGTTDDEFKKAIQLARKDKLGCCVIKIRVVGFRSNLAILVGSPSLAVTNEQLKLITNLDESGARRFFDSIADSTGSNFFLNLSNEAAKPFRARFMRFLKSKNTISETENAIHELLRRIEIHNTTGDKILNLRKMIKLSVSSIVSNIMFGFEYTDKLDELMDRIENLSSNYLQYSSMPITSINPSIIKERSEIKSAIDAFIDEYVTSVIVEMQRDPARLNNSNNFLDLILADIIKDKFEGDPHRVAVDSLIDNPDIRLCISGLLAARNISKLISTALTIYDLPELCRLVTENCSGSTKSLLSKDKSPYLHAFFLEALRLNPPSPHMFRYTKEGIENEYLSIPPNSEIIFSIEHAMRIMFEELPSFDPNKLNLWHYFIRNPAGEHILNPKLSSSKSGINMAFGMGLRSCPGSHMAEQIFKIFVGNFLYHVQELNYSKNICLLRSVPKEATDTIVPDSNPLLANKNENQPERKNATEEPRNAEPIYKKNLDAIKGSHYPPRIAASLLQGIIELAATARDAEFIKDCLRYCLTKSQSHYFKNIICEIIYQTEWMTRDDKNAIKSILSAEALDEIVKTSLVAHSHIAKTLIDFTKKVNFDIERLMRNIDSAEANIDLYRYRIDLLLLMSRFEDNINLINLLSTRNDLQLTMDYIIGAHSTIEKYIDGIKTIILKISDELARHDSRIDNKPLESSVEAFGYCADSVLDSLKQSVSIPPSILGDKLRSGLDSIFECQSRLFDSVISNIQKEKDDKSSPLQQHTLFAPPNTVTSKQSKNLTRLDPDNNEQSPINPQDPNPSGP